MVNYATKSLLYHKLRLAISILGIAIAIALIIIINGFADGFYKQASAYFRNNTAQIIVAENDEGIIANSTYLPSKVKKEITDSSHVSQVSQIVFNSYFLEDTSITLIGFEDEKDGPWRLSQGRNVQTDDEIVLDKALADEKNIKLNDNVKIYDKNFKVVGFSAGTSSFISPPNFMTIKALRSLSGTQSMASSFLVKATNTKKALNSINSNLSEGKAFTVKAIGESEEDDVRQVMSGPISVISFIALLIGLLVIALTSYVATLSKIKEYGLLKAIGAKNKLLFTIVIKQSLISTLLGFIVGIGLAFLAAFAISLLWPKLLIYITIDNLAKTALLAFLLALAASFIPIRKINAVDPVVVFK